MTITLRSVPYSENEIEDAGLRIWSASRAGRVPRPQLTHASEGYKGITVGLGELPTGNARAALQRRLAVIARMPVTLSQDRIVH